jgi:hypothetical protein
MGLQSLDRAYGLMAVGSPSNHPFNNLSAPSALQFWTEPKSKSAIDKILAYKPRLVKYLGFF